MRKFTLVCSLAFLGLALSACNAASLPVSTSYTEEELKDIGGTIESPWVEYIQPASEVSFPEEEYSRVIEKGETFTYHPQISPSYLDAKSLIWSSSDESVVTINEGVLTAVNGGNATINVSSKVEGFAAANLAVEVKVSLKDFAIKNNVLDLGFGESAVLEQEYTPSDTTQKGLHFASLNENIATVSEEGEVTALSQAGDTKIRVTSDYINTVKEVSVHVEDKAIHVAGVEITNEIDKLEVDKTYKISAKVSPDDTEEKGIIFSSSNEEVATISEEGLITTLNAGTTTINATSSVNDEKFDSFVLTVFEVVPASVEFESTSIELAPNGSTQLHPIYKDELGEIITPSRPNPTYTSSEPTVATVTAAGLVSARNIGETDITFKDGELVKVIHVEVKIFQATYTITALPEWITDDDCVIFAWIWGGSAAGGQWQELEFNLAGDEAHFTFNDDITGMLLARCVKGTTTPDWTIESGDEPGRIYNKTTDISIIPGVTSYPVSEWVEFPEIIVDPTGASYYLVGSHNAWATAKSSMMSYDSTVEGHYYVNNLSLEAEGKLKVTDGNGGWFSCASTWDNCGFTLDGENNIVVSESGIYTVHFYLNGENGNHIVLEKTGGEPVPPAPTGVETVSFKIGESTIDLVETEEGLFENEAQKFEKVDVSVTKDEAIEIYVDGVKLAKDYSPSDDDLESLTPKYNNYFGNSVEGYKIQATAASADLYLHIWESGWIQFWITGGDSATHDAVLEEGFYIYSSVTNWEVLAAYKMTQDGENPALYHYEGLVLGANDEFLVTNKDKTEWYKLNDGNIKPGAGTYDVTLDTSKLKENSVSYVAQGGEPVEVNYYLAGTHNAWAVDDSSKMTKVNDNHYAVESVEFAAGEKIKVTDGSGDSGWYTSENPWEGCGFTLDEGGNIVVTEAGTYKVDFYVVAENNNHIVITKDTPVAAVDYYLAGTHNSWAVNDSSKMTKVDDNHYTVASVDFAAGEKIKVTDGSGDEGWYTSKNPWEGCGFTLDGDDNVVVTEAGTYKVDFYVVADNENHIVITKDTSGGGEEPEPPVADVYKVTIGEHEYTLELDSTAEHTGDYADRIAAYTVAIPSVTANEVVTVTKNGVAFNLINADGDDNNIIGNKDDGFKIKATLAEEKILYFNVWKENSEHENWVSMYLQGPEVVKYDVKFNLDASQFSGWEGTTKDYSLYLVGDSGEILGTFEGVNGNLNSGSVTAKVAEGKKITLAVFYLTETKAAVDSRKQTVDIALNIVAEGEYDIDFADLDWDGEGKMTGVKFVVHGGGEPEPPTTYSVTFEADVSSVLSWDPAPDNFSLYVVLNDGTKILGDWDAVKGNMTLTGNKVSVEVNVPTGKSITMVIIYFVQSGATKQSNDIDCSITATGDYVITLGMTSWEGDKFNGATVAPKE